MNLEQVAKKLSGVAKTIETSKGPLELFGLFLREDARDLWDLVVAASQLNADERDTFEFVVNQLREVLTNEELSGFSQIAILNHDWPVLRLFLEKFSGQIGLLDVHFAIPGDTIIQRAYIILAQPIAGEKRTHKTKKPRRPTAN